MDKRDVDLLLRFTALRLESEFFADMTLEKYPLITEKLDEWGTGPMDKEGNPVTLSIEGVGEFRALDGSPMLLDDPELKGHYDHKTKVLSVLLEGNDTLIPTLMHEMIHYYERTLDSINPSLKQYVLVHVWPYVAERIPDLEQRAQKHLEMTGHRELENAGGPHDLLFLVKSYELDIRNDYTLGTVFGYGLSESEQSE